VAYESGNGKGGSILTIKLPYDITFMRLHDRTEVEVQRVDSGGECYWLLVFGSFVAGGLPESQFHITT